MNSMDEYLGKRMQNWAAMRKPPANGKVRLLHAAAHIARMQSGEIIKLPHNADSILQRLSKFIANRSWYWDCSPKFFDWTIVYSFETNLVNLRLRF